MSNPPALYWLPNALTIGRVIAAPIMAGLMLLPLVLSSGEVASISITAAFYLFIASALTDWLDGYLARKLGVTSELGARLDLWADKALVFAFLIGFAWYDYRISAIGLLALTIRDMAIMRLRQKFPRASLGATHLAKLKTALVMIGIGLLFFSFQQGNLGPMVFGQVIFYVGCGLSVFTGLQYVRAVQTHKDG